MAKKRKTIKRKKSEIAFPIKKNFYEKYIKDFWDKYSKTKWGIIIVVVVVFVFTLGSILNHYFKVDIPEDLPVEEAIESVIEAQTGIEIDLTPLSKEE